MTTRDDQLEVPLTFADWMVIAHHVESAASDSCSMEMGIMLGMLAAQARHRARLLSDGIIIP